METIVATIGGIVTIINIFWIFFWRKRTREEDIKYKDFQIDYQRRIDDDKKEMEKENQNYLRTLNEKHELLNSLERFTKLSYSTLMNSNAMLYKLKLNIVYNNNKKLTISKETLNKFIEDHYKLKQDLHVLKKDNGVLSAHLNEKESTIVIGSTYNELYFLNDYIEKKILQFVNNENKSTSKNDFIREIDKALESSDDLRKILDKLNFLFQVKLQEFYPSMHGKGPIFITGTELFEWYYPEYPFEVKGIRKK